MTPLSGSCQNGPVGGRTLAPTSESIPMETRYDTSGRVQPIHFGNMAQPGTCLLCNRIGNSPTETFATLGVELEYYGVAYLCLDCCREIADFVLYKSPKLYAELWEENQELRTVNAGLRSALKEAKGLLHARIDLAVDRGISLDESVSVPVSETEPDSVSVDRILDEYEPKSA